MLRKLLMCIVVLLPGVLNAQKQYGVLSPDGKLHLLVTVGETLSYTLSHDGDCLIADSRIAVKTGTVEYLSPRRDGALTFEITEEICAQYEALEQEEFDGLTDAERALTLGLFADGDELVHCGPEFARHYPGRAIFYPGRHLPVYPEMKYQIVPLLREFLQASGPSSGNNC